MPKVNTLFPGRPNYTGPITGWFGLLHHEELCETSHDVMERVAYVKANKPKHEVAIRLHNMIYLGDVGADYWAKRAPLYADYEAKRDALYADYNAKRDALYADCWAKRDALYADCWAKRVPLDEDYEAKLAALDADYQAKLASLDAKVLIYIKKHIPDCAWNGKTLVFK